MTETTEITNLIFQFCWRDEQVINRLKGVEEEEKTEDEEQENALKEFRGEKEETVREKCCTDIASELG